MGFLNAPVPLGLSVYSMQAASYIIQMAEKFYIFLSLHNLVKCCITFFMHGILQRPEVNTVHVCGAKNVLFIKFKF